MNTTLLILIVGTLLVLTPLLRLLVQPRVRRSSPRKRYTVFAAILGVMLATQLGGFLLALVLQQYGVASLFMAGLTLGSACCVLEMRKLSKEF